MHTIFIVFTVTPFESLHQAGGLQVLMCSQHSSLSKDHSLVSMTFPFSEGEPEIHGPIPCHEVVFFSSIIS